ncbi:tetratricopeptide repeat protein [Senegalia massiliensis]|uniref:Tetratricopeptide repeat protein n=1 Tax=Senegalia massiliensis TaxID=1720316 RepID=A0A845QSF5_9CLOT|nr:tetratricopeptide repeat protein [Senegalia massiliensis]NBI05465.1 tetratricopeptide repeat protein [Senegalia massiliensis]
MKTIEEYFESKTDNIYFIELKNKEQLEVKGIELDETIPYPLIVKNLAKEIKSNKEVEELKVKYMVDGIIYLLGIDPKFKHKEKYLEFLYSYDSNIKGYILSEGIKKLNDNKIDEALIYLRSLLNIDRENVKALYSYGLALENKSIEFYNKNESQSGNIFFKKSTYMFETILDIDPSFSLAYYKLGYHYRNSKQFKKSEIIWEKFVNMTSMNELIDEVKLQLEAMKDDVRYEEGYNLVLIGKANEGLEKLLPLVEDHGDWWNLLFFVGLAYRQLGMYSEAVSYFEKVLIFEANQIDTLNELGLCYANLEKYTQAINKFDKALELKPKESEILCNRGMTYLQMNNLKKAEIDIERAFELNPEDEVTKACMIEIDKRKE